MLLMFFIAYLIAINLVTYFLYWHDKRAAIAKQWRVSERLLLSVGFIGGTPAALLAQHRLRHKLNNGKFQHRFWALTVLQVAAIVFLPAPLLYLM